jgi:hypothetical protein
VQGKFAASGRARHWYATLPAYFRDKEITRRTGPVIEQDHDLSKAG